MSIKVQWIDEFQELLWEHHGRDWKDAVKEPNYPFQLSVAYFDWDYDAWGNCTTPERTVEEAFSEYLRGCYLDVDSVLETD